MINEHNFIAFAIAAFVLPFFCIGAIAYEIWKDSYNPLAVNRRVARQSKYSLTLCAILLLVLAAVYYFSGDVPSDWLKRPGGMYVLAVLGSALAIFLMAIFYPLYRRIAK